jgi:hypothetical protein
MEQEVMKTVLNEILNGLKEHTAQLSDLKKDSETLKSIHLDTEQNVLSSKDYPVTLSEEQMADLKDSIIQSLEVLKEEIVKHPAIVHKHISLIPLSYRMEHFPLLVNTVMRWVVVLIILIFTIWAVGGKI